MWQIYFSLLAMEKETQEAQLLTEMRRLLVNQGIPVENYGDPMLTRFLKASSMDTVKASKMLVKRKKWREEIAPLGYIPDSEVLDQLEAKKVFLQGFSVSGQPVILVKLHKHIPTNDQLQLKKFLAQIFDKVIGSSFKDGRETGDSKCIGILDLHRLTLKNVDVRGIKTAFQMLQAYYPDHLEKLFIIGMPKFFVGIWKMISYFLEQSVLDRIVIVEKEEDRKIFLEEIGIETLPEEYGGRAKLIPLQDVTVNYPNF